MATIALALFLAGCPLLRWTAASVSTSAHVPLRQGGLEGNSRRVEIPCPPWTRVKSCRDGWRFHPCLCCVAMKRPLGFPSACPDPLCPGHCAL